MSRIYSVPFRIWGRIEVAAIDAEDAREQVEEMTKQTLLDNASQVGEDFEPAECEE